MAELYLVSGLLYHPRQKKKEFTLDSVLKKFADKNKQVISGEDKAKEAARALQSHGSTRCLMKACSNFCWGNGSQSTAEFFVPHKSAIVCVFSCLILYYLSRALP